MNYHKFFEDQIDTQRRNIQIYVCWLACILIIGIVISFYLYLSSKNDKLIEIIKLGPTLISTSITIFPIKLILSSRCRIASYRVFQDSLKEGSIPDNDVIDCIKEAIKQTVKLEY
jgi:hypothetical protein